MLRAGWHAAGSVRSGEPGAHLRGTRQFEKQMNLLNALIFAAVGSVMDLLPAVFPLWFPPNGADQSSARALWLDTMGVVQIALGVGYLVRTQILPAAVRLLLAAPAGNREQIALTNPHAVAGR